MICVPEVIGKVARFVVNLEREDRGEGAALHKVGGHLTCWDQADKCATDLHDDFSTLGC